MFTGLVQGLGQVVGVDRGADGLRLTVDSPLSEELAEGDSIAVNGVCLTATELDGGAFVAELMNETVARSSLGGVQHGARVNLELPLRATDRLGGHLVQGHVDGVGIVTGLAADGFARELEIAAPADVMRYVVRKGSIAVDGVSLTVAGLREASFTVSLIPQTLERTNLGQAELGTKVNLEVDVLAKYVERLMEVSR
ncbi:MAG: riboflavin synthase [Solirubrobacterales bacterium]|nr:riboflavin synthase [Solirubrobacterales bacterium]